MPSSILTQTAQGSQTFAVNTYVNDVAISQYVGYMDDFPFRVSESGGTEPATAEFAVLDKTNTLSSVADEAYVRVQRSGVDLFRGFIRSRRPKISTIGRVISCSATDVSSLLDSTIVVSNQRPAGESDSDRIKYFLSTYASQSLLSGSIGSSDVSKIQTLNASMPKQNFKYLTLRQAIERILGRASASSNYYIDSSGRLHTFDSDHPENDAAPYAIRVGGATTTYKSTVLATAPVSYWRLGESSGTVAVDEMGANNGTYVNTPTLGAAGLLTGDPDTAAAFASASSQYVSVATTAGLQSNVVTVAAWVARATTAGLQLVVARAIGGFQFYFTGANSFKMDVNGAGDVVGVAAAAPSVNNTSRHFIVIVKDAASGAAYVDGVAQSVSFTARTITSGAADALALAAQTSAANFLNGTLDEVAIWNRALSATEIANLYTVGTTSPGATAALTSTEAAPEDLQIDFDTQSLVNFYYVRGATAAGSGPFSDATSIRLFGRRSAFIDGPDSKTAADATALGQAALRDTAYPVARGSFSLHSPYDARNGNSWRAGQIVTITSPQHGIQSKPYRVLKVTTEFMDGTGKRKVEIEFGGLRLRLRSGGTSNVTGASVQGNIG